MGMNGAWQLPLIAVGVGFHLAVSWALLWRYFQARERSLLTWGIAWLILSLHVLGIYLTRMGSGPLAPVLRDLGLAAAAVALYVGHSEREGISPWPAGSAGAAVGVLLGGALLAGMLADRPLTYAVSALVMISLLAAARLALPEGTGRLEVTRWLLTGSYLVGAVHAAAYLLPLPIHMDVRVEIAGHALFSLLFSAAVTWQAWEHERALRLFSQALERLNRSLSTQETLSESLRLVAGTLHSDQGWILLRHEGRGDAHGGWTVAASMGFPEWTEHGLNQPAFAIDRCLCLRPVDRKHLVTTVRDLACVRFTAEQGHPAGRHLTLPLGSTGQVQGIMVLMVPGAHPVDAGMLRLMTAMGEQIGLALDRARLVDELRAKEEVRGRLLSQLITAQEDERRRIARELHDETGQALTALVVNLDFLCRHPMDEVPLRQRLASVRDMAETTLAEVRRVIHEMRPSVLDDLGLEAAIRWLVRRFEPAGLHVNLEFRGLAGERLPGPLEITVFRLVQETCTNTIKHAGARALRVRVIREVHRLVVEVGDDGQGFDPATLQNGGGMGLAGMRERVSLLGGSLRVTSAPAEGTRIRAELPLEEAPEDDDTGADLRRPHDGAAGRPHGPAVRAGH